MLWQSAVHNQVGMRGMSVRHNLRIMRQTNATIIKQVSTCNDTGHLFYNFQVLMFLLSTCMSLKIRSCSYRSMVSNQDLNTFVHFSGS